MIHFGILGLGHIAQRFEKSIRHSSRGKITACASKNEEKRAYFKALLPTCTFYDNYEAMLQDPTIDAVYIALPHALHYPLAKKALDCGKHVLCEKPSTLSSSQTRELINQAKKHQLIFMEAMKTRFIPFYQEIKEDIKALGTLTSIDVSFCSSALQAPHPNRWYLTDPVQGGALYDVGPYPLSFILDFLGPHYNRLEVDATIHHAIDEDVKVTLHYPCAVARFEVAIDHDQERIAYIVGEKGTMTIPMYHRPTSYTIQLYNSPSKTKQKALTYDDMYDEIDAFTTAIQSGCFPTVWSENDCITQLEIIEDIRRSFK